MLIGHEHFHSECEHHADKMLSFHSSDQDFSEFLHSKTQHPVTDVMSVSHDNNELILHISQVLFDKHDINSDIIFLQITSRESKQ